MNTSEEQKKPGPPKKPPIREEDIQGFKYLDSFFKTLTSLHDVKDHQNRELHYDQYLALLLLYFFTPVLTSLRGIQQATTLEKIQKRLGIKKTSLGSLSEASQVFDAKLLNPLLKALAVTPGCKSRQNDCPHHLRIIELFHKGDENDHRPSRVSSKKTFRTKDVDYNLLLATNLLDLPAETIALLFTRRWQIELFFRWFKCVLGCNHLVALSKNGLTIQIYCALISGMLITLWTGRKPTKRTFEMISKLGAEQYWDGSCV
ncbi:MAG: transposase [Syntrophales bacterium]